MKFEARAEHMHIICQDATHTLIHFRSHQTVQHNKSGAHTWMVKFLRSY